MLNLLVVCNKLVSSFLLMLSYGFGTSTIQILLASSVLCISLFSPRELVHTLPVHPKPVGELFLVLLHISPYIFLKTATIPTYHSISIAVPRYIAMQIPSYITWLVVIHHLYIALHDSITADVWFYPCYARSLHILLHWQRHTVLYIMFYFSLSYLYQKSVLSY